MQPTKIFLFFLFIIFFNTLAHAQDKIILLRGDTIEVVINDVNAGEISYHTSENPDSLIRLSNSFVRRIIYSDGREEFIRHLEKKAVDIKGLQASEEIVVQGNTYFYHGVKTSHSGLEKIYVPLHDSLLNALYFRGIEIKNTSTFLKFAPIPLGAIGYFLIFYSDLPTNLNDPQRVKLNYGNKNLVAPGVMLMGSALFSGIGAFITHRCYKLTLRKSASRYNKIISKHELN